MENRCNNIRRQIKVLIWFFMVSLVISGLTAMPAREGISFLLGVVPASWTFTYDYLQHIRTALYSCDSILFYGYDWLAFAHIVIAIAFYGVIKDPVRNTWVLQFGMIACMLIIPFAFVMGGVRGIPVWWRLVDCSFGVLGIIPLWIARRKVSVLEACIAKEKLNIVF